MSRPRPRAPLAIVGTGCVLPCADSVSSFGKRLAAGVALFGEVPAGRWAAAHSDPLLAGCDALPHARGAFIGDFSFDARRFRIAPRVAAQLNPMHGVLLQAAATAVDDACSSGGPLSADRTGFVLGTEGLGLHGDYSVRVRFDEVLDAVDADLRREVRAVLERRLAPVIEDNVLMAVGSLAAGRVMNCLDLRGPHIVVDAGGASGLAAIDQAWDWLEAGSCHAVLVGGASAWSLPAEWVLWSKAQRLTATVPRPFDTDADGTLLGEGAGVLVVQRLADALRDGRRVDAIVRGLGSAWGGRHGRVAPPAPDTYRRAFHVARAEAAITCVDYVECHACGRAREDAEEVDALRRFYATSASEVAAERIYLGSVKAIIGELRGASGIAGMLKVCVALGAGALAAEPRVMSPLPSLVGGALRLVDAPVAWTPPSSGARAAAVTACSDAGSVYHLILEGPEGAHGASPASVPFPRLGIVGVGARLADAPAAESFWSNTLAGHSSIREVPPERFAPRRYMGDATAEPLVYTALGATLRRSPRAAARYGLVPAMLSQVDPSWFPMTDAAKEAVADAGNLLARTSPDRVAVVIASAPQREREYQVAGRVALAQVMAALDDALRSRRVPEERRRARLHTARNQLAALYPPITEDTLLGCRGSALAAQVAHAVGAGATVIAVESACASSLAAVQVAARGLERGAYDVAVVGGVGDAVSPEMLMTFSAFRALSADGVFPFDERASGFVLGEGAACLVLERAVDVEARGASAYAALVGCEGASDGRGGSAFAPRPEAQATTCRRALQQCGFHPSEIDYIECHAAGTAVGDVAEATAYAMVYGGHARERPVMLSSCKSAVGHLNAGAGAVGLVRAALALHHRVVPPTPGAEQIHHDVPLSDGAFDIARATTPWYPLADGRPRRAAVSGFGLGGTSFHTVLEEWQGESRANGFEPLSLDRSPLLDTRLRRRGAGAVFCRRIELGRELFLREHLVDGLPTVPAAFGCELMVQAAALTLPGLRPVGLEDVRFEHLLEVPRASAVAVYVDVSAPRSCGRSTLAVDVTVSAEFRPPARPDQVVQRRHYRGRVLLAPAPPPDTHVSAELMAVTHMQGREYRSIYVGHSFCHLGPTFQAIRTSTRLGATRLAARIDVPLENQLLADCPSPRFWLGPLAFDNYLQTAGTMGIYYNHCFPMPTGIRAVTLWDHPRPGTSVWVCATLLRESGGTIYHQIDAFDADGRVLCRCDDFVTSTGRPFSASELVMFYDGFTGGPPEHRSVVNEQAGEIWI